MSGTGNGKGIFELLDSMDRRILAWVLMVVIAIPFLSPLGIPITISQPVLDYEDRINELEPGSAILIAISLTPSSAEELGPGCQATMEFLTQTYPDNHEGGKLKIIAVIPGAQSLIVWEEFAQPVIDRSTYEYEVDYVKLGFVSGGETTVARLAEDIKGLLPTDFYGNDLDGMPMMENINDYNDISLAISWDASEQTQHYVKHWASKGVPVGGVVVATMVPTLTTFYMSGDMFGFIGGSRGSAEFEYLINKPGAAIALTDTLSLSHLYLILLVILGNLGYFMKRLGGKEQ